MLHVDLFFVVHAFLFLSFPPHLLAGLAVPVFSSGVSRPEQTQFHFDPDLELSCGVDLHRLDHRAGLGRILRFPTASRSTITGYTASSKWKRFLHGLRTALPGRRAFLQRLWRRATSHTALTAPVSLPLFVVFGGANSLRKYPKRCHRCSHNITIVTSCKLGGPAVLPKATKLIHLASNQENSSVRIVGGGIP